MPKKFTPKEREEVKTKIEKTTIELFSLSGLKKTTIDKVVEESGVAKGTFYLFYNSKEELILSFLNKEIDKLRYDYLSSLEILDENHIVSSLCEIFNNIAFSLLNSGITRLLDDNELSTFKERLGDEKIEILKEKISSFLYEIFSYFLIDDKEEISLFYLSFKMILQSFSSTFSDNLNDKTIRFLIKGIVLQMVE